LPPRAVLMTSVMDRRAFIAVVSGGLLAAPLAAQAQQAAKIARIGYLSSNLATSPHLREAFRQGLRDLGYVEGRNLVIEDRDAEGKVERLPALAAELLALEVDIIVTEAGSTVVPVAAKQATRTIPIVFASAADPVGRGLVTSLGRTRFSKVPSPATCLSSSPRSSNWSSTSRPPRRSASRSRRRCWRGRIR
jgi:putative tryptophan/tyrosine transport system substrate-binding protein